MKKMYMESLEGIEKKAVSDILTERGFEVLPAGEEKPGSESELCCLSDGMPGRECKDPVWLTYRFF